MVHPATQAIAKGYGLKKTVSWTCLPLGLEMRPIKSRSPSCHEFIRKYADTAMVHHNRSDKSRVNKNTCSRGPDRLKAPAKALALLGSLCSLWCLVAHGIRHISDDVTQEMMSTGRHAADAEARTLVHVARFLAPGSEPLLY